MRVNFHMNNRTYHVYPCPKCGSGDLLFDAGMLAGVIKCNNCSSRIILDDIFACMREWGCDNVPMTKEQKHKLVVEELRVARKENKMLRDVMAAIADGHHPEASYMAACALQKGVTDD